MESSSSLRLLSKALLSILGSRPSLQKISILLHLFRLCYEFSGVRLHGNGPTTTRFRITLKFGFYDLQIRISFRNDSTTLGLELATVNIWL